MKPKRDDLVYVSHMLDALNSINTFVKDIDYEEFSANDLIISGVIRKFEILGEASGQIRSDLKETHKNIPWRILKDFRNYLIHQYFGVDIKLVWTTINKEIPTLLISLEKIKEELEMNK